MLEKLRWVIAAPFLLAAGLMLTLAFVITAQGMNDTMGRWMRRNF